MSPRIKPGLLAMLAERVPARIIKKLDGAPDVAKSWAWDGLAIQTDGGETVTLRPTDDLLSDVEQLHCSCLLAPRCFHVLAVASVLELDDAHTANAAGAQGTERVAASQAEGVRATPHITVLSGQRGAAVLALRVTEDLLRAGASSAGTVLQGELLRLVHEARLEGAHRVSSAALRAVRGIRSLRAESANFSTPQLVTDVADLLLSAHLLASRDEVPADVLGVARRTYAPRGNLRLSGLLCEPVIARGGYAGVATWVIDDHGTIFTISDVMPAGPSRASGAYDLAIALGDTNISHRELSREALFVQNATASDDHRLGAGQAVKAVRASVPVSWWDGGAAARFREGFDAQLARAFAAFSETEERAGTNTALFLEGAIVGLDHDALVLEDAAFGSVRLVPRTDHEDLRYSENLRLLARAAGTRVRVIGQLIPDVPRAIGALAVSAAGDALPLPEALRGRINLGLDRLVASDIGGSAVKELRRSDGADRHDPLHRLRRRLERLVLHGVRSMPTEAGPLVDGERATLARAMFDHGSHALAALHLAVLASARGEPTLARTFLATHTYERTVTRDLQRRRFLGGQRGGA